jgi:SAM-dependent methyltransferase
MSTTQHPDADFAKYTQGGAYHWAEIGGSVVRHQAFTAERYRRTLAPLGDLAGRRVLDYGCGDGALLGWIASRVGREGTAAGYDPNPEALRLAAPMLTRHRLSAQLYDALDELADDQFDAVVCAEVIEHVHDVPELIHQIHRLLVPGGRAVLTTPIRLTETPEDPNHVQEWFPEEFAALFRDGPLRLVHQEQIIPAAAAEVYFWRPRMFLRVPVFRLLCNLLSIYARVNALSWLALRPRLFMTQLVVLENER